MYILKLPAIDRAVSQPWYYWHFFSAVVYHMHYTMFSNISDPYPLDANSTHPSAVETRNVFRHFWGVKLTLIANH